jgi:hypothetical protein
MAKNPHLPTISRLVRQLFEGTEHKRANMPVHGGWVVSPTKWDMKPVAFICWAHDGTEDDGTRSNMVEGRPLSPEVRLIAEMLQERGYRVVNLNEDHNFFHVVPDGV